MPYFCVEKIAGVEGVHPLDTKKIPGCTYCNPQIASVETVAGQRIIDAPEELRTCVKIMEHLRAVALHPAASRDKTLRVIKGATHYYQGQPQLLEEAVNTCLGWMQKQGLVD